MNAGHFNLISNYIKRRAQLLSFTVGVILAIVVNIHGIRLFERYLRNWVACTVNFAAVLGRQGPTNRPKPTLTMRLSKKNDSRLQAADSR